jgi:cytochrome b
MSEIQVWDRFVRVAHWTLATGFFVAYLSAEEIEFLHNWSGYVVAAVVLLRIVWGVIGPRRARFTDFVYGPRKALDYLRDLVRFRSKRYVGHSPAGGAMVVALLLLLAVTTGTGMARLAIEEGEGPLAPWLASAPAIDTSADIVLVSSDEDGEGRGNESFVGELHEVFAEITLWFVIAHIAGVVLASLSHRENLVRAMITGRKRGGDAADL